MLFLSFPSTLFNQTFSDNYAEIVAWWNRRTRRLRRSRLVRSTKERLARHDRGAEAKPRRAAEKRDFVVVFVAGAFLASLNDPTFLRGQASLVTLPAVALSMVVSLVVPALTARAYHVRRYHDAVWRLRALPAGLAIAAGCVVFSRLTNFEPGYLYGIVCGVLFTRKLGKRAQGHVAFLGLCAVLVVGVAAWFAWVPVRSEAMTNPGSIWLGFAEDVLAMVFVGGLVGAFFALLPLRGLAGFNIRRWNRRAWMAMYFVVFAVLVQVLLRPSTRADAPATHAPLIGTVVAFFAAAALSVAFFEHFERKHRTPASEPQSFAEKVRAVVEASRARKDETTDDETEEGASAKADGARRDSRSRSPPGGSRHLGGLNVGVSLTAPRYACGAGPRRDGSARPAFVGFDAVEGLLGAPVGFLRVAACLLGACDRSLRPDADGTVEDLHLSSGERAGAIRVRGRRVVERGLLLVEDVSKHVLGSLAVVEQDLMGVVPVLRAAQLDLTLDEGDLPGRITFGGRRDVVVERLLGSVEPRLIQVGPGLFALCDALGQIGHRLFLVELVLLSGTRGSVAHRSSAPESWWCGPPVSSGAGRPMWNPWA